MKTLDQRLKTQVTLAAWQLGLLLTLVIAWIIKLSAYPNASYSSGNYQTEDLVAFIELIAGIAFFVLWIIGIVGAVRINNMTMSRNTTLVIFSVFTLFVAHIIIAVITKQKEEAIMLATKREGIEEEPITGTDDVAKLQRLNKLKKAFNDDVITAKEYEAKKKELEAE